MLRVKLLCIQTVFSLSKNKPVKLLGTVCFKFRRISYTVSIFFKFIQIFGYKGRY
jgi:hypothetical protein